MKPLRNSIQRDCRFSEQACKQNWHRDVALRYESVLTYFWVKQGKQGKMKEMYQQAVADSERVTKINAADEIQHTTNARSIKERFERGEPIAAASDEEQEGKLKGEKPDEEILAAGTYIPCYLQYLVHAK